MARTPQFSCFIRMLQKARRANSIDRGESAPLTYEEAKKLGLSVHSRRRFLKATTLATGTAIATVTLSNWQSASSQIKPKIAIIGGGIAGLNAAYQLKKAGLQATVYEARNRLGGRMLSALGVVGDGLIVELGGAFINTEHEDMLSLAKELRVGLFDRTKNKGQFPTVAFYFDGKRRSEEEVAEKLRPLAQQISQDADLLDRDFDRYAPQFDKVSVAEYLDKYAGKIGAPFIRTLVENVIRTEYGVESQQSSSLQLLFSLPTVNGKRVEVIGGSDERYVVGTGSSAIIEALAEKLQDRIQKGMRLTQIEKSGKVFRLSFAGKPTIEADWVILALPFTVLRDVKVKLDLPPRLRRFVDEVSLGSNDKLIAGFNAKVWQNPNGFTGEVWTDLGFSEAWVDTQRQPEKASGALTFFFGGNEVQELQSGNAASQGDRILKLFEGIIEGAKIASNNKYSRTEWTKDPLTKGSYTTFKPGQLTEFAEFLYIESNNPQERQDVKFDRLLFAGEHLSDEFYGYMNGGAQTGRLAAEAIVRELK
jgi:monoamine oxidase